MKNSIRRKLKANTLLAAQRNAIVEARKLESEMSQGQRNQLADWRAAQRKLHAHPASPPTRRLSKWRGPRFKAHATFVSVTNGNGYAASGKR